MTSLLVGLMLGIVMGAVIGYLYARGRLADASARADAAEQRAALVDGHLAERDEEMDELHSSLIGELASGTMGIPVTMEMTLVARFYERLGDHAVNLARRIEMLHDL